MVHEKVVSLLYCRTDDQVVDIFMKSLSEAKFVKFCDLGGHQGVASMGVCANVVSPLESPEHCANGGVLEPLVMLVQQNSRSSTNN